MLKKIVLTTLIGMCFAPNTTSTQSATLTERMTASQQELLNSFMNAVSQNNKDVIWRKADKIDQEFGNISSYNHLLKWVSEQKAEIEKLTSIESILSKSPAIAMAIFETEQTTLFSQHELIQIAQSSIIMRNRSNQTDMETKAENIATQALEKLLSDTLSEHYYVTVHNLTLKLKNNTLINNALNTMIEQCKDFGLCIWIINQAITTEDKQMIYNGLKKGISLAKESYQYNQVAALAGKVGEPELARTAINAGIKNIKTPYQLTEISKSANKFGFQALAQEALRKANSLASNDTDKHLVNKVAQELKITLISN